MKRVAVGLFWLGLMLVGFGRPLVAQPAQLSMDEIQSLLDAGDVAPALVALQQRTAANNNDISALFLHGLVLLQEGDIAAAQVIFLDIAERFPALPEAANNLAAIYVAEGELEKARETLVRARENVPDYPLLHLNLGELYLQLAAESFRHALTLDPLDKQAKQRLESAQGLLAAGG